MLRRPARFARLALLALVAGSCTSADRALAPSISDAPNVSLTATAAAPNLVISEILMNPLAVADDLGEWFEVYNAGTASVNLQNWRIGSGPSGAETHTISASIEVPAGGYVVLGNNTNAATNGGAPVAYSYGTSILLNNSNTDWLVLRSPDGMRADTVAYAVRTTNASGGIVVGSFTPPNGASRVIVDPCADNELLTNANWTTTPAGTTFGAGDRGTPGSGPVKICGDGGGGGGAVASITVSPSPANVIIGGTRQFTAVARDASGNVVSAAVTWSSSVTDVATISASGVATGRAEGITTITATAANGVSGSATLGVTLTAAVATLTVAINFPQRIPIYYTKPAFATARDGDGAVISPTPTLTWSTADPLIATVDALGYITGTGEGTTTVTATAESGVSGSATIRILAADFPTSAIYRDHVEFGTPADADPSDDIRIERRQFALSYNATRGGPNWVSWNLNGSQFGGAPRCDCFSEDRSLPANVYHVVDLDYRNGGYDRGHMVQSESRTTTDQENASTFLLTNILPQAADNNQGPWSKLENYLNGLARDSAREVYVVAGAEWAPSPATLKDARRVAIPDYTWKVAVIVDAAEGLGDVHSTADLRVIAVKMPNLTTPGVPSSAVGIRDRDWKDFETTVDAIERATGYDLLAALPDPIELLVESKDKPPVASARGETSGLEGESFSFSDDGSSDPDGDPLSYSWTFGDGTTGTGASVDHVFTDNGIFDVTLTVSDPIGAQSTDVVQVTVTNVAPSATPRFVTETMEGSPFTLELLGVSDPSAADRLAGFTFAFDCGTGFGAWSTSPSESCTTTDDATLSVRARVRDKDGGETEYGDAVTVRNVTPQVEIVSGGTIASGEAFELSGAFRDAGLRDAPWSWTIDWTDGVEGSQSFDQTASIVRSHTYFRSGRYTVRLSVTDKDGGTGTATAEVTVLRLPIECEMKKEEISLAGAKAFRESDASGGHLTVECLSTEALDVTAMNVGSVRLGDGGPDDAPVARRGDGSYHVEYKDLDGDGIEDLRLKVDKAALARTGAVAPGVSRLLLTAALRDHREVSSEVSVLAR